jgi:tetratricopeptide (TPR) repeat protein
LDEEIIEPAKNFPGLRRLFSFLLILSAMLVPPFALAEGLAADLEAARNMIAQGKPAEASALLEPYELKQAGNTQFDYLLGLALLNSGEAGRASIVLERVLLVDPLYAAAWADLGRAYHALGDFVRAREDFARALELNPPPAATATINRHLAEMDAQDKRQPLLTSGYFEVGGGYNNNINNATSQNQILVPVLLNTQLALNAANVKTGDNYLGLAAGGEIMRPLTSEWSLYTGADIHTRNDQLSHDFDYIALNARAGTLYAKNAEQIKAEVVAGQFMLGGKINHDSDGISTAWSHAFGNADQAVLFGQRIRYRYPDPALASNDFYQTLAGVGWNHVYADGRSMVSANLFGGNEHDTDLRIDGGKRIQGIRLGGQVPLRERLDGFVSGGVQWGQYGRVNNAFLVLRDDRLADIEVGLIYQYTPDWALRPQINLIRNKSNIVVDQYDQTDISLTLRHNFK